MNIPERLKVEMDKNPSAFLTSRGLEKPGFGGIPELLTAYPNALELFGQEAPKTEKQETENTPEDPPASDNTSTDENDGCEGDNGVINLDEENSSTEEDDVEEEPKKETLEDLLSAAKTAADTTMKDVRAERRARRAAAAAAKGGEA